MRKLLTNFMVYGGVGFGAFAAMAIAEEAITDKLLQSFDSQSWQGGIGAIVALGATFLIRRRRNSKRLAKTGLKKLLSR